MKLVAKEQNLFEEIKEIVVTSGELFDLAEEGGFVLNADCLELVKQLEEPFSIFVCGEFNSGKSSLLNALAGGEIAEVGILPTTARIQPLKSLNIGGLTFVDSPGTNSIIKHHQKMTEAYLQRSDVILFVTSVERPLADSEVQFLSQVNKTWARKILVVLNKCDLVSECETEQIAEFVTQGLEKILTVEIPLFTVSSSTGRGIADLKKSLLTTLTERERLRMKMLGPQKTLEVHWRKLKELLKTDLHQIESEQKIYGRILRRCENRIEEASTYFGAYIEQVKSLFADLSNRIKSLVDERFGFTALLKTRILGRDRHVKKALESIINSVELEKHINSIVDNLAASLSRYQEQMLAEAAEDFSMISEISTQEFDFPRMQVERVDVTAVAEELRTSAARALNNFLALSSAAAAAGFGAAIASSSAVFEISGLILMVVLGALSFKAVPKERHKIKNRLDQTFSELSVSFTEVLQDRVSTQLSESLDALKQSLSPEIEKLQRRSELNDKLSVKLSALKERSELFTKRINAVFP